MILQIKTMKLQFFLILMSCLFLPITMNMTTSEENLQLCKALEQHLWRLGKLIQPPTHVKNSN